MPEIIEQAFEANRIPSQKSGITPKLHKYSKAKSTPLLFNNILKCRVVHGNVLSLPFSVRKFVEETVALCHPDRIHICDGSEAENRMIIDELQKDGTIVPLPKYDNCYLARTNIADVARVESRTFICTDFKEEAVCRTNTEQKSTMVNWISTNDYEKEVMKRFPGCMESRCMYIIPFSMGPIGSPLSKIGIEITDSKYVVASMRIMTRIGTSILDEINKGADYVKCLHSVGKPENGKISVPSWPCDPERVIILHKPKENEIISYGSGYGGNSLLGKKCFALRIGSTIGQREGWLAEHMLILGITCPNGTKKYIAAAFPSACGKTNLAMMTPTLPGYSVECVGDDIAWMKFDANGQLRAINPENGFFGVAPGTSHSTNPNAMKTIFKNTIFTNVASTSDGGVFWEGMEDDIDKNIKINDWLGDPWEYGSKSPAAHPNSRFCSPAVNCPIIDPEWESPEGVPISAIIFGGRRPTGVPLVYEARDWKHGVFIGSSMRSETTAAAEHKKKVIMHDPFAMRPFFGYNFGKYLTHWLEMENRCKALSGSMPKIFHVNWFRKGKSGNFLWPGFGENSRVLDWILKRIDSIECYKETPIGNIPSENALRLENINMDIDSEELFSIPKDFWLQELEEIQNFYNDQVGLDLPSEIQSELDRIKNSMEQWS